MKRETKISTGTGLMASITASGNVVYYSSGNLQKEMEKALKEYSETGMMIIDRSEEEDKIPAHNKDLIEWKRQRATTKVNLSGV
jgi:uncharacterized protein (DUF1697 family)